MNCISTSIETVTETYLSFIFIFKFEEGQAQMLRQLHALSDELTEVKRDRAEKDIQLKDNEMEQELMRNAVSEWLICFWQTISPGVYAQK